MNTVSRLQRGLYWGMLAALLAMAALQFSVTVSTLFASTLQHPFQDQFRLYMRYLTVPFPLSVLELESGHHPVFNGIVRCIELRWYGGSTWLQETTAWGAAVLVTAMLLWDTVRTLPRMLAAIGVCLIFTLLWWNANARMFIHAYEATNLFYILGGLMVAVWCADAAAHGQRRILLWTGALLACIFATLSFGPGISTFAALFVLAILRRERPAVLATIVCVALVTFAIYFWVLPGADGVRNTSRNAPPVTALYFFLARMGAPLHEGLLRFPMDDPLRVALAVTCGAFVLVAGAVSLFFDWRAKHAFSRLACGAIAMFIFSVTANFMIAANRIELFLAYPDQIFADRYLFWSCVGWLGASLYALTRHGMEVSWRRYAAAVLVLVASFGALSRSLSYSEWSATVYRNVELGTAGLALGLRDGATVKGIADPDLAATYRGVDVLRATGASGYGSIIGRRVPAPASGSVPAVAFKHGPEAGLIAGLLPIAIARPLRTTTLWVASADGALIGRAAMTASSTPHNKLRIGVPVLDRFEGYVLPGTAPAKWLVQFDGQIPVMVAELLESTQ